MAIYEAEVVQGIVQRWSGLYDSCLRAYNFNENCTDEMGIQDGVPTDVTYTTSELLIGHAVTFAGTNTPDVVVANAADLETLPAFTITALIRPHTAGQNNLGRIASKYYFIGPGGWEFHVSDPVAGYVRLQGLVYCATTNAEARSTRVLPLNEWSRVTMTWDNTTKLISLYINEVEVTYDPARTAGVGAQTSDANAMAPIIIGSHFIAGAAGYDGEIDTFRIYNEVLDAERLAQFIETPLYFVKAPQQERGSALYPYVVLYEITNVPEGAWPNIRFEQMRVQFSIVADSDDELSGERRCFSLSEAIQRCFDHQKIYAGDEWENLCVWREGGTGPRRSPDEITVQTIDYLVRTCNG